MLIWRSGVRKYRVPGLLMAAAVLSSALIVKIEFNSLEFNSLFRNTCKNIIVKFHNLIINRAGHVIWPTSISKYRVN